MPLVPAKCTVCGAVLTIDSTKEATVCQSCGNAFVVENAINNYNTYNNIVNNITADTVVVNAESEKEQLYKNGETFRSLGNYEKAAFYYQKMQENYSDDWRGWWGLVLCRTKNFTDLSMAENVAPLFNSLQRFMPAEQSKELQTQYKGYLKEAAEYEKELQSQYKEYLWKVAEADAEADFDKAKKLLANDSIENDPVVISFNSQLDTLERNLQLNIKAQEEVITKKESDCNAASWRVEKIKHSLQLSKTLFYTGVVSLIIGLLILFVWAPANLKLHLDNGGSPMVFMLLVGLLIIWGLVTVVLLPLGKKENLTKLANEKKELSTSRELLLEAKAKKNQWQQDFAEKKMTIEKEKQLYIEKKAVEFAERTMLCNEYIGLGKQRLAAYHFAAKCKQANIPAENDEVVELLRNKLFAN